MTYFEFLSKFSTEEAAIDYFFNARYHNVLVCPHCGAKVNLYRTGRQKVCICHNCDNTFSPFSGTIFEKSSTDMRKWFFAIHLVLNGYKGISSYQLQREIGVTHKTAWRMLRLIREAMGNTDMADTFQCFVEIDETYIGGKPRKQNAKPDGTVTPREKPKRGRGTDKTPVVGVKERGTKRVFARVATPNEKGQKLTGKQLMDILDKVCKEGTTVASDDFSGYRILDKETEKKYVHVTVNHSVGQFSAGDGVHTNNIENFWSMVKRQWFGTHHHYSVKYMQGYIDEMCFRQNHREGGFDALLGQCVRKVA